MPSCRLLPHGSYSLVPAAVATLAWLCSLSQDGCDYSRLEGPIVKEITNSQIIPFLEIGLIAYREPAYHAEDDSWRIVYSGSCLPFEIPIQDSYWTAAKGFAFFALVFGGAGALFISFSTCFVFSRGTWRLAGYQVMVACMCQCLSFLWFATGICNDNSCKLFFGSNADICASTFYLVASLLIVTRYPTPIPKEDKPPERNSHQFNMHDTERYENPIQGDTSAALPPVPEALVRNLVQSKDTDAEIV